MLTWALVWLCTTAGVTNMPRMFLLLAMAGDVASVFFIACACRGWPGSSNLSTSADETLRPKGARPWK